MKKVAIVTGAASGIGKGVAEAYTNEGYQVVLADVDEGRGQAVASRLENSVFVKTDVRAEEDIITLMAHSAEHFGRIDVLVNVAGISVFKDVLELTLEEWDNVINTNLRSAFLCSREAAKVMKANGGGAIINIASTRATMSEPDSEAYASSKGGILGLTHALAASLAKYRVTVNAISPGWIETVDYESLRPEDHAQHFSGRVGTPDDIARACLYLSHPDNNFVNGTELVIDGGMTRKMMYEE
ncbi:SDR family oxidoreductase [Chungangia koreensis]|uniref:SDR family oxidoreductase n=1 Tax=Chungangia koreensis TaxID=752657 RepID=A0ABV8X8J1_9LACT